MTSEATPRSYGSSEGLEVGDIVEVKKAGEWQKDPATVIGKTESGSFDVRIGYRGGLTWGLEPDEDGEIPDPYESGMVLKDKAFPDEVRSGERFKKQVEYDGKETKAEKCCGNIWVKRICCCFDFCR